MRLVVVGEDCFRKKLGVVGVASLDTLEYIDLGRERFLVSSRPSLQPELTLEALGVLSVGASLTFCVSIMLYTHAHTRLFISGPPVKGVNWLRVGSIFLSISDSGGRYR